MFNPNVFDIFSYENIPLDEDLFILDECYMHEYNSMVLDVLAGKDYRNLDVHFPAATRKINEQSIEISLVANFIDRHHQLNVFLPRNQFVNCVCCTKIDDKIPHVFVKSNWIEYIHSKTFCIFCLIDASDFKKLLKTTELSNTKSIKLRKAIDKLSQKYLNTAFISFADNVLIKKNWKLGDFQDDSKYRYNPEEIIYIIKDVRDIYKKVLNLGIYAICTQGFNVCFDDDLLHISASNRHVSLNSLGLPFEQLFSIQNSLAPTKHGRAELYLDEQFFRSIKLNYSYNKQSKHRYKYTSKVANNPSYYLCFQIDDLLEIIRPNISTESD